MVFDLAQILLTFRQNTISFPQYLILLTYHHFKNHIFTENNKNKNHILEMNFFKLCCFNYVLDKLL